MSCEAHSPLPSTALGRLSQLGHMAASYKSTAMREIFHLCSSAQKVHPQTRAQFKTWTAAAREQITLKIFLEGNLTAHRFMNLLCQNSEECLPVGTEQKAHNLYKHPAVQTAMSPAFQTYNCGLPSHERAA